LKNIFVILLLSIMLFLPINSVKANEDIIETQYEIIENYEFDSFIQELNSNYKDYIPQYSFRDLINTLRGEEHYDLRSLSRGIITFFFREISTNYHLLGQLIILSIICAVLKNVQGAFENNNIGKITYSVTYLVLIIIAIQSFEIALSVGREAIDNMVSFIQALMPVVIALLASIGGITSAAVFNPIIFMGVSVASTWIRNILLPIIFFAAVLGLISNISDRFHVSALSSFIKQVCIFLLGLFLSVFLGLLVVQGAATSTVDGISVRTAKFASKNFIPIVGGIFSDTVDTIVGCSLILKNAIGLAGLLIVFLTTLFPIIKILAMVFVYKFAGAVIQPLGEESVVKCLNDMANHLVFIVITVSSVALMFFIGITVIIASGNITVMMR